MYGFSLRSLFALFCLCVALVLCFTSLSLMLSKKSFSCPTCSTYTPTNLDPVLPRKDLIIKLREIHRDLKNAINQNAKPAGHTLLKLEGILNDLDSGYKQSRVMEVERPTSIDSNDTIDVCPEEFLGVKKGYLVFQFGWVTQNCSNVKPLPQVLSIILNTYDYPQTCEDKIELVLRGISQTYPGVQVYIAPKTMKVKKMSERFPNVNCITLEEGNKVGKIWNQLVSKVTTPYTLVARDVVHFTWFARVRRQIRMIAEMNGVGVVGGSFRNWTGHWKVGCRQITKKNYILEYIEGYHFSSRSCMFCDDLEGPFVAKTDIIKSVEFDETLPKEVVFEDFFLKVLDTGYLTMNCPDAMYINTNDQTTETKRRDKEVWRLLSTKWQFVRVLLPGGIKHSFSCQDISYKCEISLTKYALLPYCCMEQFGKAINFFQSFCNEHNILFELDAGSVLGAVKISGYIPWDIDADILLLSQNMTYLKNFQDHFRQKGFKLTGYIAPESVKKGAKHELRGGFLSFYTPDIHVETNGWPTMSGFLFLPPELRDPVYFTKVLINGYWINCMFSPGLYARNRYGLDVLKHSQSWRYVGGMGSSWGRYKPGRFLKCKNPKFHACLDKFPADGNLAFQVP